MKKRAVWLIAFSVTCLLPLSASAARPRWCRRDSDWADSDPGSVVTVLLGPHGNDATEMRIPHESLPPGAVESYGPGWDLVARQLETSLASRNHP